MDRNSKVIDNILKGFLKNEAEATDMRILSIRNFLYALNEAVEKYLSDDLVEGSSEKDRETLVNMINDMADIYRNEISELLVKRGRLQHYLEIFKTSSEDKSEGSMFSADTNADNSYIN